MTPYLFEHQNPNAPVRSNGLRFMGYPEASAPKTAVVLHTAETPPSSGSAWNVARYLSRTDRAASYQTVVDSGSAVTLLPPTAVSFNVRKFNTPSLGLSWATRAAVWGQFPDWDDAALWQGARVAAGWSRQFDIPVRVISKSQALDGVKGFTTHALMDSGRRSDPGAGFPLVEFFRRVNQLLDDSFEAEELDVLEIGDEGDPVVRVRWRINQFLHKEPDPRGKGKDFGLPISSVFDAELRAYVHHVQAELNWVKFPGKVDAQLSQMLHELTFRHEVR